MGMMSEIQLIKNEVCQEHCKHYEKVMDEGYTEDAFFDRLADLYCNECPLENLAHLLKNFLQFVVIHTVKGFGIVNKAEVDWKYSNDKPFSSYPSYLN